MTEHTTQHLMLAALDIIEASARNDQTAIETLIAGYDWHDLADLTNAFGFVFLMALGGEHATHHIPRLRNRIHALPPDR